MLQETAVFLTAEAPLPFEDLFVPLVLQARDRLRQTVDDQSYKLLNVASHASWERYLLTRLTNAAGKAAEWQFQIFKTVQSVFPDSRNTGHGRNDVFYRRYVGDNPEDRLRSLFSEFPELGRLCGTLVSNWIAVVDEFLSHLRADQPRFTAHFHTEACQPPVVKLEAGLGDPHRDGRCVARIVFEGGFRVIYKPRPLSPEARFSDLLREINCLDTPHAHRVPRCWDRGEYGWMESIETGPCHTLDEVQAFYWRAGALLGLIYLARGVDCHRGNLVAAGPYPVLIDLETLWHPQMCDARSPTVPVDSVLRTGFLPRSERRADAFYQWSSLAWIEYANRPVVIWNNVNQDRMTLEVEIRDARNRSHLPIFEGNIHLATGYASEVEAGFRWTGDALLGNEFGRKILRQSLLDLTKSRRRLVVRPTILYQAILQRLTAPNALRGSQNLVDHLSRYGFGNESAFSNKEMCALAQLDIPYFEQPNFSAEPLDEDGLLPTMERYLAQTSTIKWSLREVALSGRATN